MARMNKMLSVSLVGILAFGALGIALASQRTQSRRDDLLVAKRDEDWDELFAVADDEDDDEWLRDALRTNTNDTQGTNDGTGTNDRDLVTNTNDTLGTNDGTATNDPDLVTNTNDTQGTNDGTGTE